MAGAAHVPVFPRAAGPPRASPGGARGRARSAAERRAVARQRGPQRRLARDARLLARHAHGGDPPARLRIPRIGLSAIVVQGTSSSDLSPAPPTTEDPLGRRARTAAIAGHRTTLGAWFRHIDKLQRHDRVELAMPYGDFTSRVQRTRIVPSNSLWITRRVGYDQLVLSARQPLTPLRSASSFRAPRTGPKRTV